MSSFIFPALLLASLSLAGVIAWLWPDEGGRD